MTVKINGDNSVAAPGVTGGDTDSGLQVGTDELNLVTGGTSRVTVDSSGDVGVGTTAVDRHFHVEGTDNVQGKFQNNATLCLVEFEDSNTTAGNRPTLGSTGNNLAFWTGGSESARIDSSGRLLVGTSTAPTAATTLVLKGNSGSSGTQGRIHIQRANAPGHGDSLGDINFMDTSNGVAAFIGVQRDGGTWTAGSSTPGRIVLGTTPDGSSSATGRLYINSDGTYITSGVKQMFNRGSSTGDSSFSVDFTGVYPDTAIVSAGFAHYGLFTYGCSTLQFVAFGPAASYSTVHNQTSGNGGSWSITRVDNTTIRVTKNAGTSSGSGKYFIHLLAS